MMRRLLCPGLYETGPILDGVWAVRAGWMNFFSVATPHGLVCFDAGGDRAGAARGLALLGRSTEEVVAVFLTHAHWDHAGGVAALKRCLAIKRKLFGKDHPEVRLSEANLAELKHTGRAR